MAKIIQLVYDLVNESAFTVRRVFRPRKNWFRRECSVWFMEVPSHFTLNDIAEVISEMSETSAFIEEEFHIHGQYFVCMTKRAALQFVLYGFWPGKYEIFPEYQQWKMAA
jgi:hypothetical protein